MRSTCVLASCGLPPPPGRPCCCPGCARQAVADALVLMDTGREPAARCVLEKLEHDLTEAAVLTRLYTGMIASEPVTDPADS